MNQLVTCLNKHLEVLPDVVNMISDSSPLGSLINPTDSHNDSWSSSNSSSLTSLSSLSSSSSSFRSKGKGLFGLTSGPTDPDASRTVHELIESRGFLSQTHEVHTEDGFILVLHRIVNPFLSDMNRKSEHHLKPVLLAHGTANHAGHWLLNSDDGHLDPSMLEDEEVINDNNNTNNSEDEDSFLTKGRRKKTCNNLGFLLANLGYDVWLSNQRGNRYSNRHKKFTPDDPEYWNFTIDDMVEYDLPAMINYILNLTGRKNLAYVGNSQGSTVMFGLLATKPSFNHKVKPFIALCPPVRISNALRIPIPWIRAKIPIPDVIKIPALRIFNYLLLSTGSGPLLPFIDTLAEMLSSGGTILQHYFDQIIYLLSTSFFDLNLNRDRMSVYTGQANFALSKKNLAHLVQFIIYDEFAKFDYGEEGNMLVYGRPDPPEYDLKNITNRTVGIIYSSNDEWASLEDFESIGTTMKVPLLVDHLIPNERWGHIDYIFGSEVGTVVNEPILDILKMAEKIPDDELVSEKY